MGRQIVIQPDGKYACWSTIIDDFIFCDATREEYIEHRAKEAYEEKIERMNDIFNNPDRWPQAFRTIKSCNKKLDKFRQSVEKEEP